MRIYCLVETRLDKDQFEFQFGGVWMKRGLCCNDKEEDLAAAAPLQMTLG